MLPEVSKSKKVSRFFWAATFFLIVAAFVVPQVDFSLQEDSPRADDATDPFAPAVHEFDRRYSDQGLESSDPQKALDFAPLIKARALTEAGPLSEVEAIETAETIEKFRPQIAEQQTEGSRAALRNHRNEQIADNLTRIEHDDAVDVLDEVRDDYIDAFGVDPSWVTDVTPEREDSQR